MTNSILAIFMGYFTLINPWINSTQATDGDGKITITVHVKNLKNTDGNLRVTLFDSKDNFLQKGEQQIVSIDDKSKVTIAFQGVETGVYAVSVIHDEDNDGKMNTGIMGIPTEDYGFSNDAKGTFGPPKFEQAKFEVQGDKEIEININ